MNKINKSTKIGLLTTLVIISSSLLYLIFFKGAPKNNPSNAPSQQLNQSSVVTLGETKEVTLGQGSQEMAPVYSDIESGNATIQISEETRKNSPDTLPQGFGLGQKTGDSQLDVTKQGGQPGEQDPQGAPLEQLPVDLETPVETPKKPAEEPNKEKSIDEKEIDTMDPREVGVTANDGPDKNYEETVLTVQRTLTAVNPDGEKQLIRLKIPVMYKSRTLRLEGPTKDKAQEILSKLKIKGEELTKIKTELEQTLTEWNQLVTDTTPHDVLLPESPTLPQNQSAGRINRDDNPSMSAGKAISYEIINK
jgi:hypothetical protein